MSTSPSSVETRKPHAEPVDPQHGKGKGLGVTNAHWSRWSALLVVGVLLTTTCNHLLGEKIRVANGLGWDGQSYGAWAADFPAHASKGFNQYYTGRILPSAVVYSALGLLGLDRTVEEIIHAFGVLNIVCLTVSAWIWTLTARHLGLGLGGLALGSIGLFVNFFVLKWSPYYPVLTDVPTYLVGFLTLHSYLTARTWTLLATTVLSSFLWPTAWYLGGLLLLFPRERTTDSDAPAKSPLLPAAVALVPTLVLLGTIVYLVKTGWIIPNDVTQPLRPTLVPSTAITLVCAFLAFFTILNNRKLFDVAYYLRRLQSSHFYLVLGTLAAIKIVQALISVEAPSVANETRHFFVLAMTSVARPAAFLVSHALFFGPIVLLVLLVWRPTVRLIHNHGVGLTLATAFGVLIAFGAESRDLVNILPVVVPFAVLASGSLPRRAGFVWAFLFVALVFSKFWLRINVSPDPDAWPTRLFWSNGPWISNNAFFVQAVVVFLWGLILWLNVRSGLSGDETYSRAMTAPPAGQRV